MDFISVKILNRNSKNISVQHFSSRCAVQSVLGLAKKKKRISLVWL